MFNKQMTEFSLLAGVCSAVLAVLVVLLLVLGDHTYPTIRATSNLNNLSQRTPYISLTFNRSMDKESIREGLKTIPPTKGTISWQGKTLFYTFEESLNELQTYKLVFEGVRDSNGKDLVVDKEIEFQTRKSGILYIAGEGVNKGRIVVVGGDGKDSQAVTPEGLEVFEYDIHPDREHIVYFASEVGKGVDNQELYTTNIGTGETRKLRGNEGVFLNSFDLGEHGDLIALSLSVTDDARIVSRDTHIELASWERLEWEPFWSEEAKTSPSISPDYSGVLAKNGMGEFTLYSFSEEQGQVPLQPFSRSFGFAPSGDMAGFVAIGDVYDTFDPPRSLLYLLRGNGTLQIPTANTHVLGFVEFVEDASQVYMTRREPSLERSKEPYRLNVLDTETELVEEVGLSLPDADGSIGRFQEDIQRSSYVFEWVEDSVAIDAFFTSGEEYSSDIYVYEKEEEELVKVGVGSSPTWWE